jgi:hypothetical protein
MENLSSRLSPSFEIGKKYMPLLIYKDNTGHNQEWELSNKKDLLSIGTHSTNDIILSATLGVASKHAVVLRSAVNYLPVLVNLAGQNTRVNNRSVVDIRVLRQKDILQLGLARLTMWEIRISVVHTGQRVVGQICQVCLMRIQPGDEVVICPRCSTSSHRLCWFTLPSCAKYACNYPIRDTVKKALSDAVTFEHLDGFSELIRQHKKCQALSRGDQVAFQENEDIAYCPACQAPYHTECWLNLEKCTVPGCGYEIQGLLERVFSANEISEAQ